MITITATKLRNNLFSYLEQVEQGEILEIIRNNKTVAILTPAQKNEWQKTLKNRLIRKVSIEEVKQTKIGTSEFEGYI